MARARKQRRTLCDHSITRRPGRKIIPILAAMAPNGTRREEVYNVKLAELLLQRGAASAEAEQRHDAAIPDVLFEWVGLPGVLEAKYDTPRAGEEVTKQLQERLADGFGSIGVGLLYPLDLKRSAGPVGPALHRAKFKIRLVFVGRDATDWREAIGIGGIADVLDRAREALVTEDELKASVERLSKAVDALARVFSAQQGHADQLVQVVAAADATAVTGNSKEAKETACRVGALAVVTATILQLILCDRDEHVPPLGRARPHEQRRALLKGWGIILKHDYRAVFQIAFDVLDALGDTDSGLGKVLESTIEHARWIVATGVMGRHDLVGRVYHTLLSQHKFLATFYTSVPAATMMATLATDPYSWPDIDWAAEPEDFRFTVADPACGTGTLLAATMIALRRNYANARLANRLDIDVVALGRTLIQDNVIGYDILAYAVQVCAATLLLSAPGTTVERSKLFQLPFGGTQGDLGSLALLEGPAKGVLFGAWTDTIDMQGKRNTSIPLPEADLVIMNPPFTRSQGGSRLLGSLDPHDHPIARKRLELLSKQPGLGGRLSAGLGALFIPLADRMVRDGGTLAIVLPKTVLTGMQWDLTRELLGAQYHVKYVICSHQYNRWNFSDSTDLSEVLIVAKKWAEGDDKRHAVTTWLQLSENPTTAIDALAIATALQNVRPNRRGRDLSIGSTLFDTVGQVFTRPAPTASKDPWPHATFFKETLLRAAESAAQEGVARLPRVQHAIPIPLRPLREIGKVGYDRRDITDAFEMVAHPSGYPALWGTKADEVISLRHAPNRELAPRVEPAPGRKVIKSADAVWQGAGRLLIPERLRLTSMRCAAIVVEERCVSNTWWTINTESGDPEDDRILALWLNSTYGLLLWIYSAEETCGPWLAVKKNKLLDMPVLDVSRLSRAARKHLLACWDKVQDMELSAISQVIQDPVRAMIDSAVARSLDIPAQGMLAMRLMFGVEPRLQQAEPVSITTPGSERSGDELAMGSSADDQRHEIPGPSPSAARRHDLG